MTAAHALHLRVFAELSARIAAGVKPGDALAEAHVDPEAWEASQQFWLKRMADEAARDRYALTKKYGALYRDALERFLQRASGARPLTPSTAESGRSPAPAPPSAPQESKRPTARIQLPAGFGIFPSTPALPSAPERSSYPPFPALVSPLSPALATAVPHSSPPFPAAVPISSPPFPAAQPASSPPFRAAQTASSPPFRAAQPASSPPMPAAVPLEGPHAPRLTVEQLAAMRAEMAIATPAEHAVVRQRFGLDEAAWTLEESHWQRRLASDKDLFNRYLKRFQYCRSLLRRS